MLTWAIAWMAVKTRAEVPIMLFLATAALDFVMVYTVVDLVAKAIR